MQAKKLVQKLSDELDKRDDWMPVLKLHLKSLAKHDPKDLVKLVKGMKNEGTLKYMLNPLTSAKLKKLVEAKKEDLQDVLDEVYQKVSKVKKSSQKKSPKKSSVKKGERCEAKLKSDKKRRCENLAKVVKDGKKVCKVHSKKSSIKKGERCEAKLKSDKTKRCENLARVMMAGKKVCKVHAK
jgi:regulator of replication initiation timing